MDIIIITTFFLGMVVGGTLTALSGAWLAYLYDKKGIRYGAHAHEALTKIRHRIKRQW